MDHSHRTMRQHRYLHLHTGPPEEWIRQLIRQQRDIPETEVTEIHLDDAATDFRVVVEQIFASDSIAVW